MKIMIYLGLSLFIILGLTSCGNSKPYPQTLNTWKSYKDVSTWMDNNWRFDVSKTKSIVKQIRINGPSAGMTKTAEETYNSPSGWCKDGAIFVKETLNKINPNYKAQLIFIENVYGYPHHWVTGFYDKGNLYVMDYSAGPHWSSIMGTHGPYKSLSEYSLFLESLKVNNFSPSLLTWEDDLGGY